MTLLPVNLVNLETATFTFVIACVPDDYNLEDLLTMAVTPEQVITVRWADGLTTVPGNNGLKEFVLPIGPDCTFNTAAEG